MAKIAIFHVVKAAIDVHNLFNYMKNPYITLIFRGGVNVKRLYL